jgi:hypothetical protein
VFVTLVIQHEKRMRCIILSSVASVALLHFSTLSHKRYDFRKKETLLNMKCVSIFYTVLPETFLALIFTNSHFYKCDDVFV